jgi:hypothetical protein
MMHTTIQSVILLDFAFNLIYGHQIPYYDHSSAISMDIPSLSGIYLIFYSILSTSFILIYGIYFTLIGHYYNEIDNNYVIQVQNVTDTLFGNSNACNNKRINSSYVIMNNNNNINSECNLRSAWDLCHTLVHGIHCYIELPFQSIVYMTFGSLYLSTGILHHLFIIIKVG